MMSRLPKFTKPVISVVIVSYNSSRDLAELIPNLLQVRQDCPIEIIIVDNNSADSSIHIIDSYSDDIELIQNESNVGFAAAVNQTIEASNTSSILLLNPDTRINAEAVNRMFKYLHSYDNVAAVAPRILFPNGSLQPSRGTFPNLFVIIAHLFRLKYIMPQDEKIINSFMKVLGRYFKQYSHPGKEQVVDYTTGACVMVKKDVILQIGGFDERFFLYYEEIDIAYRLKKNGYNWVFLNDISISHQVATASGQEPIRPFFERYMSMVLYFQKHHSRWKTLLVCDLITVMAGIRCVAGVLNKRFRIDPGGSWDTEKKMLFRLMKLRSELHI